MKPQDKRRRAHRFGITSEKLAALYLRGKGYRIVAERYRNHFGEIDIVACKGKALIAVEVKARKTLMQCEESVTPRKRQKIAQAMQGLLAGQRGDGGMTVRLADTQERDIRFDVVWIAPWRWPKHIKNAWSLCD